jgi:hypothetical protein
MTTLSQFIRMEDMGTRATNAVRRFVESADDRAALNRVDALLAEVRHFAVAWDEIRTWEDKGKVSAESAADMRKALENRLVSHCVPDRF